MEGTVLFNIAGGIVSSLDGLLVEDVKLFWGVKEDLEKLKEVVSAVKNVLPDAEEQRYTNPEVNNWLGRLRDVLYEADDFLDAASTKIRQRELMIQDKTATKVRKLLSISSQLAFGLKMGYNIKPIREKLVLIGADMKTFEFAVRPEETPITITGRDSTNPFETKNEVIGRENDKVKVIEHLMNTDVEGNVSVLPILGIEGIGKTTLAQLVFKDEKIQNHFDLRMWVHVSETFNMKDIVEKILEFASGKESNIMDGLINDLKEKIDKKKYLLVLDDVKNENNEKWFRLKRVLMGGATGSKILVTTRSETVARIMFQGEPYILNHLGEEASGDLFKRVAFRDGEWPKNLSFQEKGKKILTKCAGVPLLVKMIGRLLNSRNIEMEWLDFLNNKLPDLSKERGYSWNERQQDIILSILKLCYDKLPSYLKPCFAYCSLYPKDYVYDKTSIIYQWIAHGFVQPPPTNQSLEDYGNDCFMTLLWRIFFQDHETDDINKVSGYKMHGLIHDFATLVMTGSLNTTFDKDKWNIGENACHLSVFGGFYFSIEELISQCERRNIRTFICPKFYGEIDCEAIFSSFKLLRVLNLSEDNLEHVPSTIGKLKHLRYLDLSWNKKIKVLPPSITRLVNLQFLKLSGCRSLEQLPSDIKNLVNLRHLDLYGCEKMTYLPGGVGQLTNLQLLTQFWIDLDSLSRHSANFSELKGLNELGGTQEIWNLRHLKDVALEYNVTNIKEKTGLESLMLHFSRDEVPNNDIEDERLLEGLQPHANLMKLKMDSYRSSRLPSWILSITSLVELTLCRCYNCKYLPPVHHLCLLKELHLSKMVALDYVFDDDRSKISSSSSVSTEDFFPSLSKIRFEDCPKLKGWWRNSSLESDHSSDHYGGKAAKTSLTGHCTLPLFPKLLVVWIEKCPLLTSLPLSLDIESLRLEACSSKLLQPTMMMQTPAGTLDSTLDVASAAPLSKLNKIELQNLFDLETLQEEWLKNLSSLKTFQILQCPELKSLSTGIQYLTSLEHLIIKECPKLELLGDEHGMCWQGLKSLLSLEVSELLKWVSLPLGLQHVSTLRNLQILECENLTTILESIHNWKSLEVLEIVACNKLTLLPKGIESLSSLRRLKILSCCILFKRYGKDTGPDWPKIAHIPEIELQSS